MSQNKVFLLLSVWVIFIFGLSMVFNTSSAEVLDRGLSKSTHYALIKQGLYAVLGLILAVALWFYVHYEQILQLSGFLLFLGTLLLIAVFIPGIGQQVNGSHRWLGIANYSFQPSEFIKYLVPLYYIQVVTTQPVPIPLKSFLKLLLQLSIPIGLILVEPDHGTVAIILSSLMVLFILTKLPWKFWSLSLLCLSALATFIAAQTPYVIERIQAYLHPELNLEGKGHQSYQSKIAVGSGGMWGKGLGESLQKLDYLPEARSDYIAAIFGEEFGFIGMLFLILLFMLIAYLGYTIAAKSQNLRSFYTISILTYLICIQAFLNLGVVSGLLPSKGANLPFFSQGGSSLLANFLAVCIIIGNTKYTSCPPKKY